MRLLTIASAGIAISIIIIWIYLFLSPPKSLEIMKTLAGCYISEEKTVNRMIEVSGSGRFKYLDKYTSVTPYEDKQSLSLLPRDKVVVGSGGELEFLSGNPLLLRFDGDQRSFTVPSESGTSLIFRKGSC